MMRGCEYCKEGCEEDFMKRVVIRENYNEGCYEGDL